VKYKKLRQKYKWRYK